MASATGIPARAVDPAEIGEEEPLLGRPGDLLQSEDSPIYYNLFTGTALIAQAGVILLVASVWAGVFLHPIIFMSSHPLLNSSALLVLVQSILILQPTHSATQKRTGTILHFATLNVALDLLIAGLVIIEINKAPHPESRWTSTHGILGLVTYIALLLQALVGFTQYFVPQLYGGVDNAKAIYKWHRVGGYVILGLMLATITAATQTTYNKNVLNIKLWAVLLSSALVLIGILPRIKKQKLGWR